MNPIMLENLIDREIVKAEDLGDCVDDRIASKKFLWALDFVEQSIERGDYIFHKDVICTDELAIFLSFMFSGGDYNAQAGKLLARLEEMRVVRRIAIWEVGIGGRRCYVWAVRNHRKWDEDTGRVPKSEWLKYPKPNGTDASIRKQLIVAELRRFRTDGPVGDWLLS